MKNIKSSIITIILLCMIQAQPHHHDGGNEKTRMLMKWKLTEYLDISEEQGDKFFPRFNTFQKEHKEIQKEIGQLFDEVEEMIEDGNVKSNKVEKAQDKINDLEHDRHEIRKEFIQKSKDILSEAQVAKLFVFEHKFKRKLKKEMNHYKDGKRKKYRKNSPNKRF